MAGTKTLTPDDPGFRTDYQIVVARVVQAAPVAADRLAARPYSLEVIETLQGDLTSGAILDLVLAPDKLGGSRVPNPVPDAIWVTGLEATESGQIISEAILAVGDLSLPFVADSVDDAGIEAIRRGLQ